LVQGDVLVVAREPKLVPVHIFREEGQLLDAPEAACAVGRKPPVIVAAFERQRRHLTGIDVQYVDSGNHRIGKSRVDRVDVKRNFAIPMADVVGDHLVHKQFAVTSRITGWLSRLTGRTGTRALRDGHLGAGSGDTGRLPPALITDTDTVRGVLALAG
jgi:hypothetical protein